MVGLVVAVMVRFGSGGDGFGIFFGVVVVEQ